jgi:hypothetical protein
MSNLKQMAAQPMSDGRLARRAMSISIGVSPNRRVAFKVAASLLSGARLCEVSGRLVLLEQGNRLKDTPRQEPKPAAFSLLVCHRGRKD